MPQTFSNDRRCQTLNISSKVAKKLAPEPWSLPAFSPIEIDDYNDPEEPNVALSLDWHDLPAIFRLFFE